MRRLRGWLGVLILTSALLAACGSAAPSTSGPSAARPVAPGQPPAPAAQAPAGGSAESQNAGASGSPERMIIRTGKVSLTVSDVVAGVDKATAMTGRLGGYVASSSLRESNGQQTATLSLRVPGPRYDDAVRELREMAVKVNEESSTGQDVTEEYADLGAQLRNQEAAEAQYLELLKKAQSVEDILKVQQRLTEVRGQIERLKGRMQLLQRRTDLAQIDLTLTAATASFQPFRYVRESFATSLRVLEATIGALVTIWWVLLVVAGLVWFVRRRAVRPIAPPPSQPSPGTSA